MFKYGSPLIRIVENRMVRKYGSKQPETAPVFIIGAPRSGSTIVYQLISNLFDILYFDNLVQLMFENPFTGTLLSWRMYKDSPHNCFRSEFGSTLKCGLHAPSEAGQIWYRWIPRYLEHVGPEDLAAGRMESLKATLQAVLNRHGKPLLIKNLYFAQRQRLIHAMFPDARIIYVKRDPLYIAQSLFQGRQKVNTDLNEWWSIKPEEYDQLKHLTVYEQIAGQVHYLEYRMEQDLKLFGAENVYVLEYERLEAESETVISEIKRKFNLKPRIADSVEQVDFQKGFNKQKIDDEHFLALKLELEKYREDG